MRTFALAVLVLAASNAGAAMKSQPLEWELDGAHFSGYLVYDDAGAKRPGLVMVPNWMGVNDSALEKAKAIAGDDYVVLVADVYGKDVRPANNEEAGKASQQAYSDRVRLRARAAKAVDVLKENASGAPLDPEKLGAIGFCFGGAVAIELARSGADIDAVVSFHGNLRTSMPAAKGAVDAGVLVLNGADDSYVRPEDIAAFQKEMTEAGADWQFVNFAGAVHCFAEADANWPPGCVYHERSAKRAYRMMEDFFEEKFEE